MVRYETLVLAHPDMSDERRDELKAFFSKLLDTHKGSVLSFDVWGKYRLSYPVKKNDYGTYILVRFELDHGAITTALRDVEQYFRIKASDFVLRYTSKRLGRGVSLDYQKPETLDTESPSAHSGRGDSRFSRDRRHGGGSSRGEGVASASEKKPRTSVSPTAQQQPVDKE